MERCLNAIRELSDELIAEVVTLTPAQWDAPSNCPPWRVRDLVVHVVIGGQGFASSIRQGLAGSVEAVGNEERLRYQAELEQADSATVARALDAVTTDFLSLCDGLSDAQLSAMCFHRRGNRSVRWYATHRLAEVAFHSWDLRVSLGRERALSEPVAAMLLATLLERNVPRTYAAGLTPERGRGERYLFAVAGDASARRLVTIDPDQLTTGRPGAGTAADLVRRGAITLDGDAALAERFALVFPRP